MCLHHIPPSPSSHVPPSRLPLSKRLLCHAPHLMPFSYSVVLSYSLNFLLLSFLGIPVSPPPARSLSPPPSLPASLLAYPVACASSFLLLCVMKDSIASRAPYLSSRTRIFFSALQQLPCSPPGCPISSFHLLLSASLLVPLSHVLLHQPAPASLYYPLVPLSHVPLLSAGPLVPADFALPPPWQVDLFHLDSSPHALRLLSESLPAAPPLLPPAAFDAVLADLFPAPPPPPASSAPASPLRAGRVSAAPAGAAAGVDRSDGGAGDVWVDGEPVVLGTDHELLQVHPPSPLPIPAGAGHGPRAAARVALPPPLLRATGRYPPTCRPAAPSPRHGLPPSPAAGIALAASNPLAKLKPLNVARDSRVRIFSWSSASTPLAPRRLKASRVSPRLPCLSRTHPRRASPAPMPRRASPAPMPCHGNKLQALVYLLVRLLIVVRVSPGDG